jgi:hypothetical protein
MANTIEVTETIGTVHGYANQGLNLYLTPGSSNPYWASNANFMYDKVVATPYDFLDEAGYDSFDDEADYEEHDEEVTITIERIPYVAHV